ncbi:MAG TPA: aminotransferase class I/II-fold pyridoxal phosphate-dependent enzyme [Fimbriiglobus sp.]|jgi:aspartate aminotransferase/aminotransferase
MDPAHWIAARAGQIEVSGIRKVFELGKALKDPINLSIGQPHFPVPDPIKAAAKAAIDADKNGYTVTQGILELREKIKADLALRFPGQDRDVIVTSGTSGGLLLALLATVNPGEEVLVADPYFVGYPSMITVAGGTMTTVDTYPTFALDPAKVEAAITPRTKVVLIATPANPTGAVTSPANLKAVAEICRKKGVLLLSDEIYRDFTYDGPLTSPAQFNPDSLVVEGFGKTYGLTGWRLGYAHGPSRLIDEMMKLQQCTFVCAPSMVQYAGVAALDFDVSEIVADYKRKRDRVVEGLKGKYEFAVPGGAFYLFPKVPRGTASDFVARCVEHNLLIIPGGVFSKRDTHFRLSYAATDETLRRGLEVLSRLAEGT